MSTVNPACERLRFCASGTEATMYCKRRARAATGRRLILKFEGAYHGANEVGVTSLFTHRAGRELGSGIVPARAAGATRGSR